MAIDMMFVVRRRQELARARNIPVHTWFANLQRACDLVDHDVVWIALAQHGVDTEMTYIFREWYYRILRVAWRGARAPPRVRDLATTTVLFMQLLTCCPTSSRGGVYGSSTAFWCRRGHRDQSRVSW